MTYSTEHKIESLQNIPGSAILALRKDFDQILKKQFSSEHIREAYKLIEQGKVSLSFKKGTPAGYFIVSGIVRDSSTQESKISQRSTGDKKFSSGCNCLSWTDENHCSHTAALMLKFLFINQEIEELPNLENSVHGKDAVSVKEFGTIIQGPDKFLGPKIKGNTTYFVHQYQLTTGDKVGFPIPQPFEGKIKLKLIPTYKIYLKSAETEKSDIPQDLLSPRFSLIEGENIVNEISVFESLYLFNWNSGEAFSFKQELSDLMRFCKQTLIGRRLNDYLRVTRELREQGIIEIEFNDHILSNEDIEKPDIQLSIVESEKKNFFDLNFQIPSHDDLLAVLPDEWSLFSFSNGLLDTFKKKIDAYEFLKTFQHSITYNNKDYLKKVRQSSKRPIVESFASYLLEKKPLETYSPLTKKITQVSTEDTQIIFLALIQHFGDQSFRFTSLNADKNTLTMSVRKSVFLEGVSAFHEMTSHANLSIFFNNNKVSRWNSQIKFNRHKHDIDWFNLELEITEQDLEIIKKADLESGQILTSEGLVLLDQEQKNLIKFMKKYTEVEKGEVTDFIEDEVKKKKFALPFRRARIFELFELKKLGVDGALTSDEIEFCNKLLNMEEMPQYDPPENFANILRHYQQDGYNWMRFLYEHGFGACLADDMGLGKTIQTICFVESVVKNTDKILIVCPVSILMNWYSEFEKFSTVADQVSTYYGGDRQLDPSKKIILTSYGVMKKESNTTFKDMKFDVFILDEVQNLKNIRSLGANSAREINAKFRICLTGTPVENDLSEFFNILDLSVPGVWGNTQLLRSKSIKKTRLLAKRVAKPFILRRTKSQVLTDLPPKVENIVYLKFTDAERDNYIYQLRKIRNHIDDITTKQKYGEVLKGLLKLRQLCLWQNLEKDMLSTKVKYLIKNLEQIREEGHKTLIFSQFTTYLNIIQEKLEEKGVKYSRIDGSLSIKKRQQAVEDFQNGDNEVFLISLKAGGLGLNLTAANYIFLMDPWWNPAVESQAIDRAHRIGQEKSLSVYRLIMKDSVEEKVLKLQELKKELFHDLMATDDSDYYAGKLSMKDFEALLDI